MVRSFLWNIFWGKRGRDILVMRHSARGRTTCVLSLLALVGDTGLVTRMSRCLLKDLCSLMMMFFLPNCLLILSADCTSLGLLDLRVFDVSNSNSDDDHLPKCVKNLMINSLFVYIAFIFFVLEHGTVRQVHCGPEQLRCP